MSGTGDPMKYRRALLWTTALAAFCALLVGYFALQSDADQAVIHHPNDKANHHPKHVE
jgi:hypothetical protein